MKKKTPKNPVTTVIILLIALFVIMIVWTLTSGSKGGAARGAGNTAGSPVQQRPPQSGASAGGANRQAVGGMPANGGSRGAGTGAAPASSAASTPAGGANRQPPNGAAGGGEQGAGTGSRDASQGGARAAQAVRVSPVGRGAIENSIVVSGDVLAAREVSIYPVTGGKITDLRLRVGDAVRSGEIVAIVDPSRPGEIYSGSPVRSTITGTILQAPFSSGDTVTQQSAIYIVGDLSTLVVETYIPERFSASIKSGLQASIFFDSMPAESWIGIVGEVSPILDPASRTLRIRLRFQKPDPRIRAGMFATISLVTNAVVDVLVIPRSSIINTYGSWIVFVVENGVAIRREVVLGLESESEVQILSGLTDGELVIVSGQNFLSHNESVRIVNDTN